MVAKPEKPPDESSFGSKNSETDIAIIKDPIIVSRTSKKNFFTCNPFT